MSTPAQPVWTELTAADFDADATPALFSAASVDTTGVTPKADGYGTLDLLGEATQ